MQNKNPNISPSSIKFRKLKFLLFTKANTELIKRAITGIFILISFIFALIKGGKTFNILFFVVILAMAIEATLILKKINIEDLSPKQAIKIAKYKKYTAPYSLFLYISIIAMRSSKYGLLLMFLLIPSIWILDVTAFLFGRKYGKTKISPTISPNKSYEGFIAGCISVFCYIFIYRSILIGRFSFINTLSISLLISILSQSGDFFESYLKRKAGVKDSGILLPGHGGFLDRFDSLIFTIPVIYFITIFNRFLLV